MRKDTSGPAFPVTYPCHDKGLSVRQYAAIKAMQGLLANNDGIGRLAAYAQQNGQQLSDVVASAAALYADATLAELEK